MIALTPEMLIAEAKSIAEQMLQDTPEDREAMLAILKKQNEVLHTLVQAALTEALGG